MSLAPLEPVYVEADPTRLEQIVVNILNNAAKYTPPKGRITVNVVQEDGEGVLRIRDTGVGISPEMLPRIFDLFTQGDQSLAHTSGGLGVGLTLVHRLIELHGGRVSVHSDGAGEGASSRSVSRSADTQARQPPGPSRRRIAARRVRCSSSRTMRTPGSRPLSWSTRAIALTRQPTVRAVSRRPRRVVPTSSSSTSGCP